MKVRYFIIAIAMIWTNYAQAQFVNNGAQITVQSEANIHIQGDFIHQDGFVNNSGVVEIGNDWVNNGNSNPISDMDGMVDLVGMDQSITGNLESSFSQLLFNGQGDKTLEQDIQVNNLLNLVDANLILNEQRLTINNDNPTAIDRNNGWVVSETDTNYSWLQWNVGTNSETYEIPFGDSDTYLPIIFDVSANGMGNGDMAFSTYTTTANNTPLPIGVTNLEVNGESDSLQMADRFWLLEDNEYVIPPTANLSFVYDDEDILSPNIINPDSLQFARWNGSTLWNPLSSFVDENEVSVAELSEYGFFTLRSQNSTTGLFSINTPTVSFDAYPNPAQANSSLNVQIESTSNSKAVASLLDNQGKVISTETIFLTTGNNQFQLAIQNISAGNYNVVIEAEGRIGVKKLFIY